MIAYKMLSTRLPSNLRVRASHKVANSNRTKPNGSESNRVKMHVFCVMR